MTSILTYPEYGCTEKTQGGNMSDVKERKKITLTLEHPQVKDGLQKFASEDGWEMLVFLGRREEEHYQMHRLMSTGSDLVEAMLESMTRDFPEIVVPIVAKVAMGELHKNIHNKLKASPEKGQTNEDSFTNTEEPPKGTSIN
jgi:hypothetical protein